MGQVKYNDPFIKQVVDVDQMDSLDLYYNTLLLSITDYVKTGLATPQMSGVTS